MNLSVIVTGDLESNNYLLTNEKTGEGVLIDCGDDGKKILAGIENANVRLKGILLTHGHADHIAAVDEVSGRYSCPVYIHPIDEALLKRALYNLSPQVLGRIVTLQTNAIHLKDRVDIAGFSFEVIHTPGHTDGSVCFRLGDLLFTGDTLFEGSVGGDFPPFGDLNKEIMSIRTKLFTLETDCVCYPGHGERTSLFHEKENNIFCRI